MTQQENLARSYIETYIKLADSARYIDNLPKNTADQNTIMMRTIASRLLHSEAKTNLTLALHYLNNGDNQQGVSELSAAGIGVETNIQGTTS